jgi:hypothetical protein
MSKKVKYIYSIRQDGRLFVDLDDIIYVLTEEILLAHELKCPISAQAVGKIKDMLENLRA